MSNQQRFYIDGQWVEPAAPAFRDVINPATEEAAGRIAMGAAADVERAVAAARAAFPAFAANSPTTATRTGDAPRSARTSSRAASTLERTSRSCSAVVATSTG